MGASNKDIWHQLGVLTCEICQFKTSSEGLLQAHNCRKKAKADILSKPSVKYTFHSNQFTCSLCSYQADQLNFMVHLQQHLLRCPFKCSVCKECFTTKKSLTRHIGEKHPSSLGNYTLKVSSLTRDIIRRAKDKGIAFFSPLLAHQIKLCDAVDEAVSQVNIERVTKSKAAVNSNVSNNPVKLATSNTSSLATFVSVSGVSSNQITTPYVDSSTKKLSTLDDATQFCALIPETNSPLITDRRPGTTVSSAVPIPSLSASASSVSRITNNQLLSSSKASCTVADNHRSSSVAMSSKTETTPLSGSHLASKPATDNHRSPSMATPSPVIQSSRTDIPLSGSHLASKPATDNRSPSMAIPSPVFQSSRTETPLSGKHLASKPATDNRSPSMATPSAVIQSSRTETPLSGSHLASKPATDNRSPSMATPSPVIQSSRTETPLSGSHLASKSATDNRSPSVATPSPVIQSSRTETPLSGSHLASKSATSSVSLSPFSNTCVTVVATSLGLKPNLYSSHVSSSCSMAANSQGACASTLTSNHQPLSHLSTLLTNLNCISTNSVISPVSTSTVPAASTLIPSHPLSATDKRFHKSSNSTLLTNQTSISTTFQQPLPSHLRRHSTENIPPDVCSYQTSKNTYNVQYEAPYTCRTTLQTHHQANVIPEPHRNRYQPTYIQPLQYYPVNSPIQNNLCHSAPIFQTNALVPFSYSVAPYHNAYPLAQGLTPYGFQSYVPLPQPMIPSRVPFTHYYQNHVRSSAINNLKGNNYFQLEAEKSSVQMKTTDQSCQRPNVIPGSTSHLPFPDKNVNDQKLNELSFYFNVVDSTCYCVKCREKFSKVDTFYKHIHDHVYTVFQNCCPSGYSTFGYSTSCALLNKIVSNLDEKSVGQLKQMQPSQNQNSIDNKSLHNIPDDTGINGEQPDQCLNSSSEIKVEKDVHENVPVECSVKEECNYVPNIMREISFRGNDVVRRNSCDNLTKAVTDPSIITKRHSSLDSSLRDSHSDSDIPNDIMKTVQCSAIEDSDIEKIEDDLLKFVHVLKEQMTKEFYKCSSVNCKFSSQKSLELLLHMEAEHGNEQEFRCLYCGFIGEKVTDLVHHIAVHNSYTNEKYSAALKVNDNVSEPVMSKSLQEVIDNLGKQSKTWDSCNFVCNICESQFSSLTKLSTHLQTSYLKTVGCLYCNSVFLDTKTFEEHKLNMHPGRTKYNRISVNFLCKYRKNNYHSFCKLLQQYIELPTVSPYLPPCSPISEASYSVSPAMSPAPAASLNDHSTPSAVVPVTLPLEDCSVSHSMSSTTSLSATPAFTNSSCESNGTATISPMPSKNVCDSKVAYEETLKPLVSSKECFVSAIASKESVTKTSVLSTVASTGLMSEVPSNITSLISSRLPTISESSRLQSLSLLSSGISCAYPVSSTPQPVLSIVTKETFPENSTASSCVPNGSATISAMPSKNEVTYEKTVVPLFSSTECFVPVIASKESVVTETSVLCIPFTSSMSSRLPTISSESSVLQSLSLISSNVSYASPVSSTPQSVVSLVSKETFHESSTASVPTTIGALSLESANYSRQIISEDIAASSSSSSSSSSSAVELKLSWSSHQPIQSSVELPNLKSIGDKRHLPIEKCDCVVGEKKKKDDSNVVLEEEKIYVCKFCKFECLWNEEIMLQHIVNTKNHRFLKCYYCANPYFHQKPLQNHIRFHHGNEPLRYTELGINEIFLPSEKEKKQAQKRLKNFRCKRCNSDFYSIHHVCKHYKSCHKEATMKWIDKKTLNVYSPSGRLLQRKEREPPKERYMCTLCTFRSELRDTMYKHLDKKHEYSCKARLVKLHGFSNYEEKKDRNSRKDPVHYNCNKCDAVLSSEFFLRIHLAKHKSFTRTTTVSTLDGLLICSHCNYIAHSSIDLANHVTTHVTDRRFKCSICDFECHHRKSVESHIKKKHDNVGGAKVMDREKRKGEAMKLRVVNLCPTVSIKRL